MTGFAAIIDGSGLHQIKGATGSKPLHHPPSGAVVLFDGYVSNGDALKADLLAKGARIDGRGDAELVLHAYLEWGKDCLQHIDGEFAFVIWDAQRSRCFAARDHHGLRPLYYHLAGTRLIVASELAPIVASLDAQPRINRGYLAEVAAAQHYSRHETIWQNVNRLTAAHCLIFDSGKLRIQRYWSLPMESPIRYSSEGEYAEHYRHVLTDCLCAAADTDAPLAMDVSGGLDSSSLYCLAHKLLEEGTLPAPTIRGYTLAGEAGSPADELRFARDAAAFAGGDLTEVALFEPPLDWFRETARAHHDIPPFTNGAMSIDMENRMASDGCKVSIGGNGGDQWLDGTGLGAYQAFRELSWQGLTSSLGAIANQDGRGAALQVAMRDLARAMLPAGLRRSFRLRQMRSEDAGLAFWLAPDLREELRDRRVDFRRRQLAEPLARLKHEKLEDAQFQLAIEQSHAQAARAGIELRSPMLSRGFIGFSAGTPEHIRRQGSLRKHVHRRAMAGILPQSIIDRRHEASFPESDAIRRELISFLQDLSTNSQVFDASGLRNLSSQYQAGEVDGSYAWEVWGVFASALFASR